LKCVSAKNLAMKEQKNGEDVVIHPIAIYRRPNGSVGIQVRTKTTVTTQIVPFYICVAKKKLTQQQTINSTRTLWNGPGRMLTNHRFGYN
jgi:hypothetical protein